MIHLYYTDTKDSTKKKNKTTRNAIIINAEFRNFTIKIYYELLTDLSGISAVTTAISSK